MDIGFAVLLPEEPFNYARQIELRLARELGSQEGLKQPPHITFKAPFAVDEIEPFVAYLDEVAGGLSPFEVILEGFGGFAPRVLFLDVQPNPLLLDLHQMVIRDLGEQFGVEPSQFEGQSVMFHSTVAIVDLAEERFARVQAHLKQENPRFTFMADTLGLFYRLDQGAGWIVYHQSSIKG